MDSDSLALELRQLTDDTANYLSQFSTEFGSIGDMSFSAWARRSVVRTLRNKLPATWWQSIQEYKYRHRVLHSSNLEKSHGAPFATFVLEPTSLTGLIQTFFSLTHQTYSGWQLVLVETHDQSHAIRRAILDFRGLDQRITVVNGANPTTKSDDIQGATTGQYLMQLTDGITLRFQCLEWAFALTRANPSLTAIACDYQSTRIKKLGAMRCYNYFPNKLVSKSVTEFDGVFRKTHSVETHMSDAVGLENAAHVPKMLFSLSHWTL